MADTTDTEQAEPAPPSPQNEVEITVAGHTVIVKSCDPLADVIGYAHGLFDATAGYAKRLPIGFDTTGAHIELAAPPERTAGLEPLEE